MDSNTTSVDVLYNIVICLWYRYIFTYRTISLCLFVAVSDMGDLLNTAYMNKIDAHLGDWDVGEGNADVNKEHFAIQNVYGLFVWVWVFRWCRTIWWRVDSQRGVC